MIPLRLVRRHHRPAWMPGLFGFLAAGGGLLLGYGFLELAGADGGEVLRRIFLGSLGSWFGLQETLIKSIPLTLAGLSVAVAFRMRLWNIGAEGQFYAGALAATYVALFAPELPRGLRIPALLVAAMLAGALWALLPGLLRAGLGVSEILVTLMLNYVAILVTDHLCYGPWRGAGNYGFPMSDALPESFRLGTLGAGRVHHGLLLALGATVLLWVLLYRTRWGFSVRAAGANPDAAEYAGFPTRRNIVLVLLLSGLLAGLAGGVELAGIQHRLQPRFSPGYGYTAILVAWLARLHPLAVPPVALLFGALLIGGEDLQLTLRLPASLVDVFQGLILLSVLVGEFWTQHRLVRRRRMP